MRRNIPIVFIIISMTILPFTLSAAQPLTGQDTSSAIIDDRFATARKWLVENNLNITTSPDSTFIHDYVMVTGEGVPSADATSPAQKRLTAERAATVIAYRNLAEILDGVAVVGESLVRDAATQYDAVKTAVSGFIKGAEIVFKDYNEKDEIAIVIIKVGMKGPTGFGSLLYDKILGDPNIQKGVIGDKPPFQPKQVIAEAAFDGLIIDATDHNFRPALINRIFNPRGEVLYDPSRINQKVLVENGCGEYTNTVEKAKSVLALRGVKNPLIVKAEGTMSPSDLKVSEDDAVKIFSADQKGNFLRDAKVAFVLK